MAVVLVLGAPAPASATETDDYASLARWVLTLVGAVPVTPAGRIARSRMACRSAALNRRGPNDRGRSSKPSRPAFF